MSRTWLILLALLLCLSAPLPARPYTVDDLLRHEEIGQMLVDPTGRWLALEKLGSVLALRQKDRTAQAAILRARPYVLDLQRGGPLRALPGRAGASGTIILGFSPKGTRLAIGQLDGDSFALGLVTVATGATDWLPISPSHDGFHNILQWLSEDQLLVIAEEGRQAPWRLRMDIAPDRLARKRWDATTTGQAAVTMTASGRFLSTPRTPARRLLLVDRGTGKTHVLARGRFSHLTLSPRRDQVALVEAGRVRQPDARTPVHEDDAYFASILRLVDLRTRAQWLPCPACVIQGNPRWDEQGRTVAFLSGEGEEVRAMLATPATRQLRRLDSAGARPGGDRTAGCVLLAHEDIPLGARASIASGNEDPTFSMPFRCAIMRGDTSPSWLPVEWHPSPGGVGLRLDDTGTTRFLPMSGAVSGIDAMPLGTGAVRALVRVRMASGMTSIYATGMAGMHALTILNRHMAGVAPAVMRAMPHTAADGTAVTSWLVLPPERHASALPLVVIPYPGQQFGAVPPADQQLHGERPYANAQILAAAGYAVLLPSLPMPPLLPDDGFSFAALLEPAIAAALSTGCCDAGRIALWGHSYGAYAAVMASAQSQRFRAVIASAGIYDLAATIGTFGPSVRSDPAQGVFISSAYAWAEAGQGRMGAPPWATPARYVANSPIYLANHIEAPMLIIGADRDFSPIGQAEQLFSALFRQGKDAQLLTYWGEGHVIGSPGNLHDLHARVLAFLHDCLSAEAPALPGAQGSWRGGGEARLPRAHPSLDDKKVEQRGIAVDLH